MIQCGLHPEKAVAWDWPDARHPRDQNCKGSPAEGTPEILYVSALMREKGIFDLIEAVRLLRNAASPLA